MKQLFNTAWGAIAIFALVAASMLPAKAFAQSEPEAGVIVSIAKIQEQLDDIGYLLDGSGFGQFKFMINMQAKEFLKGVDTGRPAGALLYFSEDEMVPNVVGFLPVSNLQDVLTVIGEYAEVEKQDDGIVSVGLDNGTKLFVKEAADYVELEDECERGRVLQVVMARGNLASQGQGRSVDAGGADQVVLGQPLGSAGGGQDRKLALGDARRAGGLGVKIERQLQSAMQKMRR